MLAILLLLGADPSEAPLCLARVPADGVYDIPRRVDVTPHDDEVPTRVAVVGGCFGWIQPGCERRQQRTLGSVVTLSCTSWRSRAEEWTAFFSSQADGSLLFELKRGDGRVWQAATTLVASQTSAPEELVTAKLEHDLAHRAEPEACAALSAQLQEATAARRSRILAFADQPCLKPGLEALMHGKAAALADLAGEALARLPTEDVPASVLAVIASGGLGAEAAARDLATRVQGFDALALAEQVQPLVRSGTYESRHAAAAALDALLANEPSLADIVFDTMLVVRECSVRAHLLLGLPRLAWSYNYLLPFTQPLTGDIDALPDACAFSQQLATSMSEQAETYSASPKRSPGDLAISAPHFLAHVKAHAWHWANAWSAPFVNLRPDFERLEASFGPIKAFAPISIDKSTATIDVELERGTLRAKLSSRDGRILDVTFSTVPRLVSDAASERATYFDGVAGILSMPAGAGPFPLVVLVPDLGLIDRHDALFTALAKSLAVQGVASLRYDSWRFRMPAARRKTIAADRGSITTDQVTTAKSALAAVRTLEGVDPKRIFLLGYGMGALALPLIADVPHILLAPPGTLLPRVSTQVFAEFDKGAAAEFLPSEDVWTTRVLRAAEPLKTMLASPTPVGRDYWFDLVSLRVLEIAQTEKSSVLLVRGDRDPKATAADAAVWQTVLGARLTTTVLEGADHRFSPQKSLDPRLVSAIAEHVLK